MNLSEYEGKYFNDFIRDDEKSFYCHNYLHGLIRNGKQDEIYAWSDDDNWTEYRLLTDDGYSIPFAESFTSEGDKIYVYPEYK